MSRLSIVIPYLGNPKLLEETLLSVLENQPKASEVIVPLARHYEDPYDLGDEVRFLTMPPKAGLVDCLNLGFGMSRTEIIHVLLCGTEVGEDWTAAAVKHFDDPRVACVAPLVVDGQDRSRVVAAGVEYHPGGRMKMLGPAAPPAAVATCRTVLAPHPAAAFYRKATVADVGRFDAEVGDQWAVLDLALTLDHGGFRTVLESNCRVSLLPEAQERVGAFFTALAAERFFWRWAPSAGWIRSLALHGITWASEGWQMLPNPRIAAWAAGRLIGCCSIGNHRRRRLRLGQEGKPASRNGSLPGPRFSGNGKAARPSETGATAACR